ncbi:hypothetical protein JCM10908_000815 [Rhodotorula pacifica]|uniref:uncharacterized protein n=1 Tax=Rhodotorula pacifica TaxID=1495444 RepID=UPI0031816342
MVDQQRERDRKRPRTRSTAPPRPSASLDQLVRALEQGDASNSSPPLAWSSHSNLLAIAAPPTSHAPTPLVDLLYNDDLLKATTTTPMAANATTPTIQLTGFSGAEAACPRVRITLPVPVPVPAQISVSPPSDTPASSSDERQPPPPPRVTHLSFSPDSAYLLAVMHVPSSSSSSATTSDLITLYEQRGACIDEWDCVAQEDVARLAARSEGGRAGMGDSASPQAGGEVLQRRVVSLRWVGESRRWYPAPTFPDPAREQAKKPLYCAPPRSAPCEGGAFVAVLSSDEVLFMHFQRRGGPGETTLSPFTVVCLPLHPSPSPAAGLSPSASGESTSSSDVKATAIATWTARSITPTPVPIVLSLGPGLGSLVVPPPPTANGTNGAKGDSSTPSATVDALVNSLAAPPAPAAAAKVQEVPKPTEMGSGQAALLAELQQQQQAEKKWKEGRGGEEGRMRRRKVEKAAIGACRSRGTAELGETVFVVASWSRGAAGATDKLGRGLRRRKGVVEEEKVEKDEQMMEEALDSSSAGPANIPPSAAPVTALASATGTGTGTGTGLGTDTFMTDDDFSLLVDFSSLDEAFGGGNGASSTATAAAAGPTIVPLSTNGGETKGLVNGHGDGHAAKPDQGEREIEELLAQWEVGEEDTDDEDADIKWKVELTEVRIEMLNPEGPRLTVRPQAPLYLSPLPASCFAANGEYSNIDLEPTDPVLTHLTFLGDAALPHPLQQTTSSPSLALDGSEAAVDLSLLAVTAHRLNSPSSSPRWSSTLTSYALSKEESYPLSEAFQTLENRKVDAPTQVDGESGWVARLAACRGIAVPGGGGEGLLCAVEIRPGGGEWASVTGLVARPAAAAAGEESLLVSREEEWESRVVRLSSVTLEPLDGESTGTLLPGRQLYDSIVNSPNGAFVCALQYQHALSPVIAAAPLSVSTSASATVDETSLVEPLSTRLAITIVRQSDAGDLLGRIAGLRDADQTLAILQRTKDILQAMMPAETLLEASALGMELLAIAATLYRSTPELVQRAGTARQVLEVAACVRALKKAEKRERGGNKDYKPDADAIWPLVGHCVWYCSTFLENLASSLAVDSPSIAEAADPVLLILHTRFRQLVSTAARAFLALDAYLLSPESGSGLSDVLDLAKSVVHDAVTGALDGHGLEEWVRMLEKVNAEVDGGPAMTTLSPAPFWSLEVPEALQTQASRVRSLLKTALPSSYAEKPVAPPSPHATPSPTAFDKYQQQHQQQWDVVRRARFSARVVPARSCVRCGARTAAVEGPAAETELVGQWRRFEAEWNGRCLCGGMWRRAPVAA